MNIAIGKIGKSILFNESQWGVRGGDIEAPTFYENLFLKNPDINFYLIGASDFGRLDSKKRNRINKHNNIIDVYDGLKEFKEKEYKGPEEGLRVEYIEKWTNENISKIDAGLLFAGPTGTNNVFGRTRKITSPDDFASPLSMLCKFAGPVIHFLNITKIPYALIVNDPRYFPSTMRDLFHRPKILLSQYDEIIKHTSRKSYSDLTNEVVSIKSNYTRIETIFLVGKEKDKVEIPNESLFDSFLNPEPQKTERNINFMVVCNEGKPSRYPDLKKYILDHVKDIDIYGHWDNRVIGNDERFKGPKKFEELQKMLPHVKYTFCIPIKKGWVTSKFWEMAHYGIIPFLHPEYDTQNHLKCPPFLRISSPDDLFKKIKFLENNPKAYKELQNNISNMLKEEYYNGSFLNNLATTTIKELVNETV
jgi:hypothetical protein